jgi:transposase
MARHWPELDEVLSLQLLSVLTLLSKYGGPSGVAAHEDEAKELLRKSGGHFLKEDKRQAVLKVARDTLGVPCTEGEQAHIKSLAQDLIRTHKASTGVEKRMAQEVAAHKGMTELAALSGKTTCVVLTAILGDLRKYPNAQSLLKATGLNLKERSSGKHKGQLKITKRGSGKVRHYLYWLVLRLVHSDPHVKAWYERKVARDGGRFKGRAIIAVMRKVVKALWYVAQGEQFDSRKLFDLGEVTTGIAVEGS